MKKLKACVKDALEAAALLYALVVVTLILRSVNNAAKPAVSDTPAREEDWISDYERGRRDERRARLDAATERAKAVSQGIEREAFEEMKRRVTALEEANKVYVRPAADIAARAKAELEGKGG